MSDAGRGQLSWLGDELRTRMQKLRLSIIVSLTIFCSMVLSSAGFATTIGLYTLLGYFIVLCAVGHLMACAGLDLYDLHDSVGGHNIYPVRVRTPLYADALPYVFVWLLWWIISELFHCALVLFADTILWQFFFLPGLAIAVTWMRSVSFGGHAPLAVLQIATLATLFFPTLTWAPQHSGPLLTTARVILYFTGVLSFDYIKPPQTYHTLQQQRSAVDGVVRRLIRQSDLEAGEQSQWREQITCVVAAHESVANESARVYEIATLTAWLLVSPFLVSLLGLIAILVLFLVSRKTPPENALQSNLAPPAPLQQHLSTAPDISAQQQQHQHHHHHQIATSAAFLPQPMPPLIGGGGGGGGGAGPLATSKGQQNKRVVTNFNYT